MKLRISLLILISLQSFAMEKENPEDPKWNTLATVLVQDILSNPSSQWETIPKDMNNYLAPFILYNHGIISYILNKISITPKILETDKDYVELAQSNKFGDKIVKLAGWKTAKISSIKTGQHLMTLVGHENRVMPAHFNKCGDKIVTTSDDNTAKIWDTNTGKCLMTFKGHTSSVRSARLNRSENKLVTTTYKNIAKIWDVKTGECLLTIKSHSNYVTGSLDFFSAQFNEPGDQIITISTSNKRRDWANANLTKTAIIWDIREYIECRTFLKKQTTFKQARILNAIYEIIVARRLVTNHNANAFHQQEIPNSLMKQNAINEEKITFEFNGYPHLQKHYNELPKSIRDVLNPYITQLNQELP